MELAVQKIARVTQDIINALVDPDLTFDISKKSLGYLIEILPDEFPDLEIDIITDPLELTLRNKSGGKDIEIKSSPSDDRDPYPWLSLITKVPLGTSPPSRPGNKKEKLIKALHWVLEGFPGTMQDSGDEKGKPLYVMSLVSDNVKSHPPKKTTKDKLEWDIQVYRLILETVKTRIFGSEATAVIASAMKKYLGFDPLKESQSFTEEDKELLLKMYWSTNNNS